MDRQTLLDLAKRCEEATDPDRDMDAEIAVALGHEITRPHPPGSIQDANGSPVVRYLHGWMKGMKEPCPGYTASLDAAMTLVPAGCTEGGMTWEPEGCRVELQMPTQVCSGTGATPALALTAAALRALAAMEPGS